MRLGELVATALAVLGVAYAWWVDRRTTRTLRAIELSMPTRFVGTFPAHIDEISEHVRNARHEIIILADGVAYGHFSSFDRFDRYFRLMQAARKDRHVAVFQA